MQAHSASQTLQIDDCSPLYHIAEYLLKIGNTHNCKMSLNYALYFILFESICNSPLGQTDDLQKMVTGLLHIMG